MGINQEGRIEEKMEAYVVIASEAQPSHRASGQQCHGQLAVCLGHTTNSSEQDVFDMDKSEGRRSLQSLM